jgi:micrococcal nuclease
MQCATSLCSLQEHGTCVRAPAAMLRISVIALLLLISCAAVGAEISGIVTEVHDGDTLTLVNASRTYRIRLADIDAPELAQHSGQDARTSLSHLCALRHAVAETSGEDRYGRTLATVTCAGVNANSAQVRRGWAWVYRQYVPKASHLYNSEREARLERRGLWANDSAVPPWDWRR